MVGWVLIYFMGGYLTILLTAFLPLAQPYLYLMDTHHILILLLLSLLKQMAFFCIVYPLKQLSTAMRCRCVPSTKVQLE